MDDNLDKRVEHIRSMYWDACDVSMPRRGGPKPRRALVWWNEEIAELRKTAGRTRRTLARARRTNQTQRAMELR